MAIATSPVVALRHQRCLHHPQREASARCPECGRYFCRECITEHDDRVVCAGCLAKLTQKKEKNSQTWELLPRIGLALAALIVVFVIILLAGNALLSIPSHFHEEGGW